MKRKETEAKTFVITFRGDVSAGRLEDALYLGLERNEESWKSFSIKEVVEEKSSDDDHIIAGRY